MGIDTHLGPQGLRSTWLRLQLRPRRQRWPSPPCCVCPWRLRMLAQQPPPQPLPLPLPARLHCQVGVTALHQASYYGRTEVVRALLAAGARIEAWTHEVRGGAGGCAALAGLGQSRAQPQDERPLFRCSPAGLMAWHVNNVPGCCFQLCWQQHGCACVCLRAYRRLRRGMRHPSAARMSWQPVAQQRVPTGALAAHALV